MTLHTDELTLGACVYSGAGRCRGPKYGEVYEIREPGKHPGYMVVTRSSAQQAMFAGHRAYIATPSVTTLDEALEQATADAYRRNQD